jgi:glyoxylase-like metal-dependent hydrolase (beta-lactamase superfamily II)
MIYGEARFSAVYGEIVGIPAERIDTIEDGRRIGMGRRTLEFIHTPGHASHHLCIVDRDTAEVFTGDTFGVSYRELDTAAGEFVFPTTSPSQFDPEQLHLSIDRILEFKPKTAYLTHYSRVDHVEKLSLDLHSDIDAFVRIARSVAGEPDCVKKMEPMLFEHLSERLECHGFSGDRALRHTILDGDVALNAAGLHSWLSRRTA